MSVASELETLQTNIGAAYTAIGNKGGTVPANKNTDNLATAINSISGGGGGGMDPTDPQSVYEATRPSDWLEMPTPAENEVYYLWQIPNSITDAQTMKLAVTTSNSSASRSVEFGTITGGTFVPDADISYTTTNANTVTTSIPVNKFGNLTSENKVQLMVKVSSTSPITKVEDTYNEGQAKNYIVEISGDLPSLTSRLWLAGTGLKYVSMKHTNMNSFQGVFNQCYNLLAVLALDTSHSTSFESTFAYCYNLIAIPQINTSSGTNFQYMFSNCYSLTKMPQLNLSSASGYGLQNMFSNCYGITELPSFGNYGSSVSGFQSFMGFPKLAYLDLTGLTIPSTISASYALYGLATVAPGAVVNFNANIPGGMLKENSGMGGIINGSSFRYKVKIKFPQQTKIGLNYSASSLFPSCIVYVPDDLLAEYQADSYWSDLGDNLKGMSEF